MSNIILDTDSYKTSHWVQYPTGTQYITSYIESRGGEFDTVMFFGLQAWLKEYISKPITAEDISEAEMVLQAHGVPFNRKGWEYILNKYSGYLPLSIKAVPEGTVVPVGQALVTLTNTDPHCYWLTSYVETSLLRAVWYPTTVATLSREIRKVIKNYLDETADSSDGLPFKLHDFGARGVSSKESAGLGGMAHLATGALGTDTIESLLYAKKYYNEDMAGFSIPASEHSTMTLWGKANELGAFRNMLTQYAKPGSMLAVVIDSYDPYNAARTVWGEKLKQEVIDSGALVILRPDSGDPVEVVCNLLQILSIKFGYTVNSKGYKLINNVRVIQGDGINYNSITNILFAVAKNGFSTDNIAFGMGGGLLQQVDRDTQKFAMKASAALVNDEYRSVCKTPVTDKGKRSKEGVLTLVKDDNNNFRTVDIKAVGDQVEVMRPVYLNGELLNEITFAQVRENAKL